MTGDDVSHGELQRRIVDLAATTVRKDVYEADQRTRQAERTADRAEVRALEEDVDAVKTELQTAKDRRAQDRRLFLSSLAFPIVVGIVLLVLTAWGHQ